jgi:hypothetical protein
MLIGMELATLIAEPPANSPITIDEVSDLRIFELKAIIASRRGCCHHRD